jgi:hypothetical protein
LYSSELTMMQAVVLDHVAQGGLSRCVPSHSSGTGRKGARMFFGNSGRDPSCLRARQEKVGRAIGALLREEGEANYKSASFPPLEFGKPWLVCAANAPGTRRACLEDDG